MDPTDTHEERPSKRVKIEDPAIELSKDQKEEEIQLQKELNAGITCYVSPNTPGFSGILKQRYTDFLVNEVLPNGKVLHLNHIPQPMSKAEKHAATQKSRDAKEAAAAAAKEKEEAEALKREEKRAAENGGEKPAEFELPEEHRKELVDIFGETVVEGVLKLYAKIESNPTAKSRDLGAVTSEVIEDKDDRTKAHIAVRRIFPNNRFETFTTEKETIMISKAAGFGQQRGGGKWTRNQAGDQKAKGKLAWQELGGEYLHFTLYKENKDTMESISYMGSVLKTKPKDFGFAGTKDRRGVTVQRASVYRVQADRMANLNRTLNNSAIGDFKYEPYGLKLGDLKGNEFTITLRDCHFPGEDGKNLQERVKLADETVSAAVSQFQQNGYINYYGLQRFGSFANGTDQVGKKLLQEDLKGAVDMILSFHPNTLVENATTKVSSDDRTRAQAIDLWQRTKDGSKATQIMPRKFSAETNIIRHLSSSHKGQKTSKEDWQGAIACVPRNLRLMYVHAYQSLVWNMCAGKRIETYGNKVVEGDLVIVGAKKEEDEEMADGVDEDGEVIINPGNDDRATHEDDFERARPLSKTEAESGKWNIFDIVLPLPGFDVEYPKNEVGQFYIDFMGSERGGGLDPYKMSRKWKDISLSGGYRKLMSKADSEVKSEIQSYISVEEKLVETDWDKLEASSKAGDASSAVKAEDVTSGDKKEDEDVKAYLDEQKEDVKEEAKDEGEMEVDEEEKKIAVILRFQLGSSQYATMALRELMKAGGVKSYVPEFSGRN
ncbi:tRNA pseudouridine synthase D [Venturia nashicola]|nr:tRNA pseudouridine synthase D [Venturia nashicola]